MPDSKILSDPWFDTKGLMNDEELNTPSEVSALQHYLAGSLPLETAARSMMTMDESQIPLDDKELRICWLLFDASMTFVSCQDDILELETAIAKIPDDEIGLTDAQKARFPEWKAWKWLNPCPSPLDIMRRSYWGWRYRHREEDADPRDCYRRWRDVTALLAKSEMRVGKIQSLPHLVQIISDGLESEPWREKANKITHFPGTIEALDADVPAAAITLVIEATLIYDFIVQHPDYDAFKKPTCLWSEDKPGLSMERWGLWKERLLWVQEQGQLDQETRDIARAAHANMIEAERKR